MKRFFCTALTSLLLFSAITLISGCKPKITESIEELYPDGSPKISRSYKESGDKKELVKETIYYPNHNKQIEGEYKDNKRHGKWIAWFENGKVQSEGFIKNGKNDGLRTVYYNTGVKYYEGTYKEGKTVGKWRFYNEDGTLAKEIDFGEGK